MYHVFHYRGALPSLGLTGQMRDKMIRHCIVVTVAAKAPRDRLAPPIQGITLCRQGGWKRSVMG
jgi:hypothetical protein